MMYFITKCFKFQFFISFQMTHWHSPNFHAFFPTANSYPGIVGDMMCAGLGSIGFTWVGIVISLISYHVITKIIM